MPNIYVINNGWKEVRDMELAMVTYYLGIAGGIIKYIAVILVIISCIKYLFHKK